MLEVLELQTVKHTSRYYFCSEQKGGSFPRLYYVTPNGFLYVVNR